MFTGIGEVVQGAAALASREDAGRQSPTQKPPQKPRKLSKYVAFELARFLYLHVLPRCERSVMSRFDTTQFADSCRVATCSALASISLLETIVSVKRELSPELMGWGELRRDIVMLPEVVSGVHVAISDFRSVVSRAGEPDYAQAKMGLRNLHRELISTAKWFDDLADRLQAVSFHLRSDMSFGPDSAEMLWRSARLAELLMPDPLTRTQFLRDGMCATLHVFDMGFMNVWVGSFEGPLRDMRLLLLKQALNGLHVTWTRTSPIKSAREEALLWPLRSPAAHFLDLCAASVTSLRRQISVLKSHLRRHLLNFENQLSVKRLDEAKRTLSLAIDPQVEEGIGQIVLAIAGLGRAIHIEEEWRDVEISDAYIDPPQTLSSSAVMSATPIIAPWW